MFSPTPRPGSGRRAPRARPGPRTRRPGSAGQEPGHSRSTGPSAVGPRASKPPAAIPGSRKHHHLRVSSPGRHDISNSRPGVSRGPGGRHEGGPPHAMKSPPGPPAVGGQSPAELSHSSICTSPGAPPTHPPGFAAGNRGHRLPEGGGSTDRSSRPPAPAPLGLRCRPGGELLGPVLHRGSGQEQHPAERRQLAATAWDLRCRIFT
jgi:hypothetical protein